MLNILLLSLVALLVCESTAQQAQLVYDQHFVESSQPSLQQSPQPYYSNQNFVPNSPAPAQQQPLAQRAWPNQPPGIAMFPPQHAQPAVQFQPHPIEASHRRPPRQHRPSPGHMPPNGHMSPQPFPQGSPHPVHNPQGAPPPGAIPIPVTSEFASRRGPIDKIIQGAKQYFPGSGSNKRSRRPGTPIRFMEMNRLPKPPKYPLYDMPDLGMATPPPPPLMHPMSVSSTNMFATYANPPHPQRGGRPPPRGKKGPPRRPPPPSLMSLSRRPPRPGHSRQGPPNGPRSNRRPPHGKHGKGPQQQQEQTGYEHGMASSLDPQVSSPPLGRPLNYDEYMKRPSHSFTDDPWNFDPFAANYNSGMNTFAMKYNYDPLGMNSLDKTQSHLDPEQLSYPGDVHSLQDAPVGAGKTTQLGGWDKSPDTYRHTGTGGRVPPPRKDSGGNHGGDLSGIRRNQSPQQQQQQSGNSFNQFYSDQSDSGSGGKSDNVHMKPLKILSDANPGIEFTIESSSNGEGVGDMYKGGSTNYETQYPEHQYPAWNSYQQNAHDVYGGTGTDSEAQFSQNQNNYAKSPESQTHLKHLQESSKYENGNYDAATQLHTFGLSQDYVPQERPLSDLSDNFNPHGGGGLSTDLTPPSETAAMFKRQGSRASRHENTPMVELEGLSLFKDILRNEKASATRNHLIRVLTN